MLLGALHGCAVVSFIHKIVYSTERDAKQCCDTITLYTIVVLTFGAFKRVVGHFCVSDTS